VEAHKMHHPRVNKDIEFSTISAYSTGELEKVMRMYEGISKENMRRDDMRNSMLTIEVAEEGTETTGPCMDLKERTEDRETSDEMQDGQLTIFEEPSPLAIEEPLLEKEIEDTTSIWVQPNVLKLSVTPRLGRHDWHLVPY
ncbi:hypothetical protein HAX54_040416, partial [Datura stramonium]|nr:hypothetical protein [Datura stramonium]